MKSAPLPQSGMLLEGKGIEGNSRCRNNIPIFYEILRGWDILDRVGANY